MSDIHARVDDQTNQTGLEWDAVRVELKYGLTAKVVHGPFAWASSKVFGAAFGLDKAAQAEYNQPGSGLDYFHFGQQNLGNAWDALKQLPCRK